MVRRVAPRALRTPISRVRSVTRDQHDVHDADAADHEADAGDADEKDEEAAGERVPKLKQAVRGEDGEVVRLVGADLAAAAQHLADLVFDRDFVLRVVVLHADPVVEDLGVDLAEGEEREVGGVVVGVLAAAEDLLLLGEDADDGEDVAFDLDFLADGGFLAEELLRGIVAEDDDVGAALLLLRR